MKTLTLILFAAASVVGAECAMAGPSSNVIARYSEYYKGSDDAFANCLVLENGKVLIYIDGLVPASIAITKASETNMKGLVTELKKLPAKDDVESQELISTNPGEFIVSRTYLKNVYPGYVKVDRQSSLANIIRAICKIDPKEG